MAAEGDDAGHAHRVRGEHDAPAEGREEDGALDAARAASEASAPAPGPGTAILKVYTGVHRGAEMPLASGRHYVVGNGEAADILMSDSLLEAEHLRLEIGDGVFRVVPADGDVLVDGRPLATDESLEVAFGGLIGIGGTRLAIGRREDLPDRLEERADEEREDPAQDGADTAVSVRTDGPDARPSSARRRKLACLGAALATFSVFVVLVFSQSPQPLERSGGTLAARVERAVADVAIADRAVVELPDGTVMLRGYVVSEGERRAVAERVDDFGQKVSLQLWSEQGLVDASNRVLASLKLGEKVSAVAAERGRVVFEGDVASRGEWDKASNALHEDVPGIDEIADAGVDTVAGRTGKVRRAIAGAFPEADLTVIEVGGEILVRGSIPDAAERRLRDLLTRLEEDLEGGPGLVVQVAKTREELLDLNIRGVSAGRIAYVVTEDGDKYMEGGRFESGYVIESIEPNRLVLSKDGRDIDYPL